MGADGGLTATAQRRRPEAQVTDGVFFEMPAALPRGRHSFAREAIVAAQRERLMAAVTELMAERGYGALRVGDIAARAGVSRAAFYTCFAGKDACAFAAYDRFIGVLLDRLAASVQDASDWPAFVEALLGAYLGTLEQDLVVARAFQVEMDALGAEARLRRRLALIRFAEFIRAGRMRTAGPVTGDLPLTTYVAAVYAIRQLASDALDEQDRPDLRALLPDASRWMTAMLTP